MDENKFINRNLVEGDVDAFTLQILDTDGVTPIDTTGWIGWVTIKESYSDADEDAIWQDVSNPTGDDATNGLIPLTWDLSLTVANTVYVYDVQVKSPDGVIRTWDRGKIAILPEVTRARL